MAVKICIAGITGWTGSAVCHGARRADDLELVGGVSRSAAGEDAGERLGVGPIDVTISATVAEALDSAATDVLIDYTHPEAVKAHAVEAMRRGVSVVVGTSGLNATDYEELDGIAQENDVGIIAAGNFSVTAALAKHFAGIAARHIHHWEIIDYAHAGKPDAPSGTAQELSEYLGSVATNEQKMPASETLGRPDARGATIGGAQVHSLRLPSYVISFETIFGLEGERLSIRHDAGSSAEPYVNGTLLAARKAVATKGLVRGLDVLLFPPDS